MSTTAATIDIEKGNTARATTPIPVHHEQWNHELTWTNISYEIKGKKETKYLLKNLTGSVKSGEMVAIMGSSGAGKTTLLNCLSGRLSTGTISGKILYDSYPRNPRTWRRTMAFVEQDDVLYSQITVRETLRFAASLRLPATYTAEQKGQRADEILKSLRLTKAADTPIGDGTKRGVSGGERKRCAIGQELVGDPEILFLDEPTSGLDSNSALAVMENVKQDAETSGRIVIATIHQPSTDLLNVFDKIILLSGGSTVFFGPPREAVTYFTGLGYPLKRSTQNPADHFMDLLTIDLSQSEEEVKKDNERIEMLQKAFISHLDNASPFPATKPNIPSVQLDGIETTETILDTAEAQAIAAVPKFEVEEVKRIYWANSWFKELSILTKRSWLQFMRDQGMFIAFTIRTIILVILIGFTFFRIKNDQKSIQNRVGILFFWPVNTVFNTIMPILGVFPLERLIMLRERATRSYRVSSFYLSKVLTETVPNTIFTLLGSIPLYYMMGLRTDSSIYFFRFLLIQWVEAMVCLAVGFLIGAAVPVIQLAQVIGPLVGTLFLLYGGCLINNGDLPAVFKLFQYISPVNFAYNANMINELEGFTLTCEDPSQPCFDKGEQVLKLYALDTYSLWTNIYINVALFFGYLLLGLVVLRILGKPKTKLV
ncbi:ATP-binding cassette sub- G member 2 [Phlyctochytrium planicorne]|nr:ATP-binding cassette sub- G member 2 [Phlyctochytrium planicorne]